MRALLVVLLAVLAAAGPAAAAPRLVELGRFTRPVHVAAPPDDARLFVVEQGGTVRVLDPAGTIAPEPFIDLTADTSTAGNERGLLSIAFPPDYATSGLFYVFLTAESPAGQIQVREYRRSASDPNRADPTPVRTLITQDHPRGNHNGGGMQFGPDGKLWVSVGDGGASNDPDNSGQTRTSLLAKILRLDPRGASLIPADNPFASPSDGARDEIWAQGLRNPWRFSFDRRTGDLWIGDVGQDRTEEIDLAPAAAGRLPGANYGWKCFEGSHPTPGVAPCTVAGHVLPVHELDHLTDRVCSITGGYVVRDPAVPSLAGRYLYTDICLEHLRSFAVVNGRATDDRVEAALAVTQVSSFGEDACGRILVVELGGSILRLAENESPPCMPAPGGAPPALAAARCSLSTRVPRTRTRQAFLRSGITLRAGTLAACSVSAVAEIPGVGRLRARPRKLVAGQRVTLHLPAGRSIRRALSRRLRSRQSLLATITVTASAPGTAAETDTKRTRLRR